MVIKHSRYRGPRRFSLLHFGRVMVNCDIFNVAIEHFVHETFDESGKTGRVLGCLLAMGTFFNQFPQTMLNEYYFDINLVILQMAEFLCECIGAKASGDVARFCNLAPHNPARLVEESHNMRAQMETGINTFARWWAAQNADAWKSIELKMQAAMYEMTQAIDFPLKSCFLDFLRKLELRMAEIRYDNAGRQP